MIVRLLMAIVAFSIPWPSCNQICPKLRPPVYAPQPPKPEVTGPARVEYNGAILVCDEPVHDVGVGWIGPAVKHQFAIRNDGTHSAWVRVYYSVGGVLRPCITKVESGETIYTVMSMRSDKLRGRFEKLITVKVLPDLPEPAEQPWCIRRVLDNACEATP